MVSWNAIRSHRRPAPERRATDHTHSKTAIDRIFSANQARPNETSHVGVRRASAIALFAELPKQLSFETVIAFGVRPRIPTRPPREQQRVFSFSQHCQMRIDCDARRLLMSQYKEINSVKSCVTDTKTPAQSSINKCATQKRSKLRVQFSIW